MAKRKINASGRGRSNPIVQKSEHVIRISVGHGQEAIIDASDYPLIAPYWWYARHDERRWYVLTGSLWKEQGSVQMHRLILGLTDPTVWVDHKDSNGLNNRRSNLRIATASQNMANARLSKKNRSGYKGVQFRDGLWRVCITKDRQAIWVGSFKTAEEGARAYDIKAREFFGEFARLNFPEEQQ